MNLDINSLINLKGSNDFEHIKQILIRLKDWENEFVNYKDFEEYLRLFKHYRLYMKPEYICDTYFHIEETNIIESIIKDAIDRLLYCFEDRYSSINEIDMANNCSFISRTIKEICDKRNITSYIIEIYPGYDKDVRLFGIQGWHYFNLIYLNNKTYLVDLSYKQFFKRNLSFIEEIGVDGLCAPLPGIFMLMNKDRKKVAETLLKKGYIELKDNNFKLYCDGFSISYRNGLYYEKFGNVYDTEYTNQDYINFLINKNDNQINHESIKCLGPLKL